MPIKRQKRVIYDKNPLREVICQIRFPKLLEIDAEVPARFQAHIGKEYPVLEIRNVLALQLATSEGGKPEFIKHFDFSTEDGQSKITLTSEFIALSSNNYIEWRDFRAKVVFALSTFLTCYPQTPFFSRIGLRYIDRVSPNRLGFDDVPWKELISPHFSGVMGEGGFAPDELESFYSNFTWKISEEIKAIVQFGLTDNQGTSEFFIDADYFSDIKTKATQDGASGVLEKFRPHTYDLFRWSITDRLHLAMGPREVD